MMMMYGRDIEIRQRIEECYCRQDKAAAPLGVHTVKDGILLPGRDRAGGVLDEKGVFVKESAYAYQNVCLWGGDYAYSEKELDRREETVIFVGQMQRHWGNFLFDCLARMWYPLREKSCRIVYCSMDLPEEELKNPEKNYSQLLALLGITMERVEEIRKPVRFARILIPEPAVFPGAFYSDELREIYDTIVKNAKEGGGDPGYDKIYLTRTQMTAKKELGEEKIEKLFAANGYRVIAPETLPVVEQIRIFCHCRSFASLEGTTSHNIVFAGPDTEHIILRKQNYINTRQILFDKLRGIEPVYIDVFYEPYRGFPLSHDSGPFWVGIRKSLVQWAREAGMIRGRGPCGWFGDGAAFLAHFLLYSVKCLYYKYVLHR